MDLQAAETAHQRDKEPVVEKKKAWACPCNGCSKAVKQERQRILEELENIDIHSPAQLNAVGFKQVVTEIVKAGGK